MNRIRELRLEKAKLAPGAFTLAAVAARVGVTTGTVWRWEAGERTPSKRHARALAHALGVAVADLRLAPVEPAGTAAELRPLAAAIVVRDGKVLLTERRFPGHGEQWSWPSGKIEAGESLEDAILRELREELLIADAQILRYVGDIDLPSGYRMSHFHVAIPADVEPKLNDYEQLVRVEWMTRDEAQRAFATLSPEIADRAMLLLEQVLAAPEPAVEHARPSVAACYIVKNQRLLMVRRRKQEGGLDWAVPSGQVEADESPEEAAVREVREELGMTISVDRRLGDRVHPATGRHLIYFACRIVAGDPALVADDEISAIEWSDLTTVTERWASLKGGIFPPVLAYLEETMSSDAESGTEVSTRDVRPTVASAIIVKDGRVLMTKRRLAEGALLWNFVTGELEPGETPEEAVVREVQEEVGLMVAVEQRLGERIHPASGRHMVYFACRIVVGKPVLVDHEENAEVRWATLSEAAELLVPTGGIWQPVLQHLERAGVEPGVSPSLAEVRERRAAERRAWAGRSTGSPPATPPTPPRPQSRTQRP